DVSLTHPPLPSPPVSYLVDPIASATITSRPDLFKIVTPIKVDRFAELLSDHPNQPFVRSVIRSLRYGFWPYTEEKPPTYPSTWDAAGSPPRDEKAQVFLREQRDEEVFADRWSPAFGHDLLPGMVAMPLFAIPKPNSDKFRLINHLSYGKYSVNSLVPPESIRGTVLDGVPALGDSLRQVAADFPDVSLLLWKSDVAHAYRNLPVAPQQQLLQINTIDHLRHVDRNLPFGHRGSLKCWQAFNSLVIWIAEKKRSVHRISNYVDDSASGSPQDDLQWFEPFQQHIPSPLARLLSLYDELGIPYDRRKQLWGPQLPYIGFLVDVDDFSFTFPEDRKLNLITAIEKFVSFSSDAHRRRTIHDFQALAGHISWSLNVFPLLRPCLANIYDKISGKSQPHAKAFINNGIVRDLQWFLRHIQTLPGIRILATEAWTPADLDELSSED
ncbi:uncharacterized protein BXZ73DRAFT_2249, partial [Epithele typhae]|uniref:uncharacterized protein n=1 Tax=Epithele typhae TaxID=378194 RepID=UPI0020076E54